MKIIFVAELFWNEMQFRCISISRGPYSPWAMFGVVFSEVLESFTGLSWQRRRCLYAVCGSEQPLCRSWGLEHAADWRWTARWCPGWAGRQVPALPAFPGSTVWLSEPWASFDVMSYPSEQPPSGSVYRLRRRCGTAGDCVLGEERTLYTWIWNFTTR